MTKKEITPFARLWCRFFGGSSKVKVWRGSNGFLNCTGGHAGFSMTPEAQGLTKEEAIELYRRGE